MPTLARFTDTTDVTANEVSTTQVQPPSGLTVSRDTGVPVLTWSPSPSTFATGYNVYAATSPGGPYGLIGSTTGRTATTWTDPEPTRHRATTYVVTATAHQWASGNSNESTGAAQSYADTVLTDRPVGYWRLGSAPGTATLPDSSGNGRDATLIPGTALGQPSLLGTSGNTSMTVTGTGYQGATVAHHSSFASPTLTLEMWIRTPASMGQAWRGLFDKYGTSREIDLFAGSTDNQRVDRICFSGGPYGETVWPLTTALAPNTVHHIMVTATSTGVQRLYVDGIDQGTVALARQPWNPTFSPAAPLRLGMGDTNYWNSGIDEVALYDTVLTADQARAHYRAGSTPAQAVENTYAQAVGADRPIGYWRLGEAPGSPTIADYSGNNRHATRLGTTPLGQPSLVSTTSNTAMTLDGTGNQGATVPYDTGLNLSALTIEMWIRTPAVFGWTSTQCRGVFDKDSAPAAAGQQDRDYNVFLCSLGGTRVDRLVFSGGPYGESGWVPATPLTPNTTYHLAFTANTAGQHRAYLNGVDQGAPSIRSWGPTGRAVSTAPIRLGLGDFPGIHWNSAIDEIALYNKVLTPTQVVNHFNAGSHVPQYTTVTNSGGQAQVAWQPPPADDAYVGYRIYRGTSPSTLTEIGTATGPDRTFTDTTTLAAGTYWYAIAAITPAGDGPRSASLPFTKP